MGEYSRIAEALIMAIRDSKQDGNSDGITPEDIPVIVGSAIGLQPITENGRVTGAFNCYPGIDGYGCCDLAVFVSLRSALNTRGKRRHYSFSEILQWIVRHMQGVCKDHTRCAVLVTENFDLEELNFWRPNLKRIMEHAHLEIYLIEGGHVVPLPV